jgi:hypothetical protein
VARWIPGSRYARPGMTASNFGYSEIYVARLPNIRNNGSHQENTARSAGARMQYFVVMIDYGRRGREAIVDPEITRREVVSRIASGEYSNISFIHEIEGSAVEDITEEILTEAALPDITASEADLASRFDHVRDLRKHETV